MSLPRLAYMALAAAAGATGLAWKNKDKIKKFFEDQKFREKFEGAKDGLKDLFDKIADLAKEGAHEMAKEYNQIKAEEKERVDEIINMPKLEAFRYLDRNVVLIMPALRWGLFINEFKLATEATGQIDLYKKAVDIRMARGQAMTYNVSINYDGGSHLHKGFSDFSDANTHASEMAAKITEDFVEKNDKGIYEGNSPVNYKVEVLKVVEWGEKDIVF